MTNQEYQEAYTIANRMMNPAPEYGRDAKIDADEAARWGIKLKGK